MRIKLIAFDLDGTLLRDDKSVPEENLLALKAAAVRGVQLVPATGRIVEAVPEVIRTLPNVRYYIAVNGAYVVDAREDRVLYRGEIPVELALRVCEYGDTLPVLYDCYQYNTGWISRDMLDRVPAYFIKEPGILQLVRRTRTPVEDLKETFRRRGDPVQKLQFYFQPDQMDLRQAVSEELARRFPELTVSSSLKNNLEINSVRAGKGNALLALAESLGLDINETVAFGDGTNDLEMLRRAGLGVAMANAAESVKAAADLIADSNENAGVAKVLRQLLAEDPEDSEE